MAEPKENLQMEKIVSLCKRRGFIFQSSEIYGGINGFWDYGPLGAELKRNVKELWWNSMTRQRDDVAGLEATIIMSPAIWKASGHVDTFADLMRECPVTKKRARADQVDPQSGLVLFFIGAIGESDLGTLVNDSGLNDFCRKAIEEYVLKERPSSLEQISISKLAFYAEELIKPFNANDGSEQLAKKAQTIATNTINRLCKQGIAILVPNGKPQESAIKKAVEFYSGILSVKNPIPLFWQTKMTENSVDFHPESGFELTQARPFNLMFKTFVGPVESEDNVAYLRPETAQAIFAQFKNVLETSRQKVPFGIGQIGKAFRNEVTPRNYTFRSREFEQMELEFFIKPDEAIEAIHGTVATVPATGHPGEPQPNWGWQAWHQYWVEERVKFYEGIGLSHDTLGFHIQTKEELAHYARACTDILFKFPFSKNFDLSQHQRFSGKPQHVFDDELRQAWSKLPKEKQDDLWRRYYENRKNYLTKSGVEAEPAAKQATDDANALAKGNYVPHVIEPSAGVDRLILALIANAYAETTKTDDKGKSETTYTMKFHPRVAPLKAGIFPLLKNKPELVQKALEVRDLLRPWMNVLYDDSGSIGKRYARQDEAGTPFCVTIDFDTLGEKPELLDTVTLRFRDDGRQERLKISELRDWLLAKIR